MVVVVFTVAGIVFLSPWTLPVLARPGRLLTGVDPVLAPLDVPAAWELALGRPASDGLPPLWLSASLLGLLWLLAATGVARRAPRSSWWLALAGGMLCLAVGLSRLVVAVPPHGVARPQASEWVIGMIAGLVVAACVGLDGLGSAPGRRPRARRVAASLAGVSVAAALLAGAAWWVVDGLAPLSRSDDAGVPTFVRRDQEAGVSRTLALRLDGQRAG